MVYIDNMDAPFGRMIMNHMIADTTDELHKMAHRIGVARKWYQGDHYDVCLSAKAKAIKLGAKEISIRDLCLMNSKRHWLNDDTHPLLTVAQGKKFLQKRLSKSFPAQE